MKKNLGLFGIGRWGKNLARNFYELGALHAVCDYSPKLIKEYKETYKDISFTSDGNAILNNPNIDKVVIATPAATHKDLIIKSLKANKNVYVEKPLCLNLKEADEIKKLYNTSKILMVGHLLHYHPCIEKIKQMVKQDKIGKIVSIHSNRLNLGTIRSEEDVFWSFAPHDISIILSLIEDNIEEISIFSEKILVSNNPDIFHCHLKFSSNVNANIKTSWLNPYKEQKLSIIGTHGMILFDDLAPWEEKIKLYSNHISKKDNIFVANPKNFEYVQVDKGEPLKRECQHFLDCCRSQKKPITDFEESIRVIELLEKISFIQKKTNYGIQNNYFPFHPTSTISNNAKIGEGTKVWHYSHVMEGAILGKNCSIGQNVFIQKGAKLGNNVKVQNNVSVYDGVICEDGVFLGPSMVFTNVKKPRSDFPTAQYAKTIVKKGATIGANATIVCGVTIGEYALIGAGSVVTKDVKPFSIVAGNPAKQIGWISRNGNHLQLPISFEGSKIYKAVCEEEKIVYYLKNGVISFEKIIL